MSESFDTEIIEAPAELLLDEIEFEIKEEQLSKLEERLGSCRVDDSAPIKSFATSSDTDQRNVIADKAQTIRVVAPAGAGKTQTQINRLIQNVSEGMRPDRVLMLTFDTAAAAAIKQKLSETLRQDPHGIFKTKVTTLNAFGYSVIRTHFPKEYKNIASEKRIQFQNLGSLKRSLAQTKPEIHALIPSDLRLSFFLEYFSLLKNNLIDPRNLRLQDAANFILDAYQSQVFFQPKQDKDQVKEIIKAIIWMYKNLDALMSNAGYMDFDDQKLRAWACLKESPDLEKIIQRQYDEIIVDEFQDINLLDFELVRSISGQARLVVTGDDDQAIYGFRGCSPNYMINFSQEIGREVSSHELKTNYRCPNNIVEHSSRLIKNNLHRIPKTPIPARQDKAAIKLVQSGSAQAESKLVASFIKQVKKANKDLGYADFSVLYRNNAQCLPIQVEFILRDIPYFVREQDSVIASDGLHKLLGVLRLKLALEKGEPLSPLDGVLALKAYFRTLDEKFEKLAYKHFEQQSSGLVTSSLREALGQYSSKYDINGFAGRIDDIVKSKSLMQVLTTIGRHFKGMAAMVGSLEDVSKNEVPLGEMLEIGSYYNYKIPAFVEKIATALERAERGEIGKDKDGVALATPFRAKGLQWHTVIILGANNGVFPHKNAPIEDERRLFYVAITRASSNLMISYLKRSCGIDVHPSRFLFEAGFFDAIEDQNVLGTSGQLDLKVR